MPNASAAWLTLPPQSASTRWMWSHSIRAREHARYGGEPERGRPERLAQAVVAAGERGEYVVGVGRLGEESGSAPPHHVERGGDRGHLMRLQETSVDETTAERERLAAIIADLDKRIRAVGAQVVAGVLDQEDAVAMNAPLRALR